ncbi:hypothetical protein D3H64_06070 [Atopobacter sp. AH10]|uniref:hypothetical protein n=1 Tax=Atopobacter sp. AH10 TaxID=2315861 RepID=UPI000EF1FE5B|nr:hypothetical protein [Atopobacter sp. AH10]RLK63157.1 hypothetical protein D3H64_06070 [Atopobacter sp. AH10]
MAKYKVLTTFSTENNGKTYKADQKIEMKVSVADVINEQAKELHGQLFLERLDDSKEAESSEAEVKETSKE